MRDIATATLSGNLTREVELRAAALGHGSATAPRGQRDTPPQRRGVGRADEPLHRRGLRPVGHPVRPTVSAEARASWSTAKLDWREWTDQGQNRGEAVVLRARQILFERTGSTPPAESEPDVHNGSPDGESDGSAEAAASAGTDNVPF
jgi:hypothetical protein